MLRFEEKADSFLSQLIDIIDTELDDVMEAELQDGILTINLDNGRQYILNKHCQLQQLWLSSPVSGASHYTYNNQWQSTRDDKILTTLLEQEFSQLSGKQLKIEIV
jgi:iron-sulfur cluster assembly protein CyaY